MVVLLGTLNNFFKSQYKFFYLMVIHFHSRRDFVKTTAVAAAATAVGIAIPKSMQAATPKMPADDWRWDKSVCRFCGTGCGIMVATKKGRIVAVKGDPAAPVNRGLNCIKGYFNAKIMGATCTTSG